MTDRHLYLDNLTGLLILDMIFFVHVRDAAGVTEGVVPFLANLMCFFMAWFFFKSGMFYKRERFRDRIRKDAGSLLLPYAVSTFFTLVIYYVFVGHNYPLVEVAKKALLDIYLDEAITWNAALWFLPSLFIVKALANVCIPRIGSVATLVTALAASFLLNRFHFTHPIVFGNVALGLAFYTLGHLLKDIQFNKWVFLTSAAGYLAGLGFTACHFFDFRCNTVGQADSYPLVIVFLLAGIITFDNVFRKCFDKRIPLLTGLGRKSIIPYTVHYPFIVLFVKTLSPAASGLSEYSFWLILSILTALCITTAIWSASKSALRIRTAPDKRPQKP